VVSAQLIASDRGCIRPGVLRPNTLALSVFERTREPRVLRAIGMARRRSGRRGRRHPPRPSSRMLDVLAAISTE
jgi:hypothetical protein